MALRILGVTLNSTEGYIADASAVRDMNSSIIAFKGLSQSKINAELYSKVGGLTDALKTALAKLDAITGSIYQYKGSVSSVDSLPTTATAGDVYNVTSTGMNYAATYSTDPCLKVTVYADKSYYLYIDSDKIVPASVTLDSTNYQKYILPDYYTKSDGIYTRVENKINVNYLGTDTDYNFVVKDTSSDDESLVNIYMVNTGTGVTPVYLNISIVESKMLFGTTDYSSSSYPKSFSYDLNTADDIYFVEWDALGSTTGGTLTWDGE